MIKTTAIHNDGTLEIHPELASDPGAELVDRLRARDPEVIRWVVDTYGDQLYRASRGAGFDPTEAEELSQAVFVTFLETLSRFEGRSHVRTWLFGILYRKMSEARRKLGRQREVDPLDTVDEESLGPASDTWGPPLRSAEDLVLDKELMGHLRECLDKTPLDQRMVFILREINGLETPEILESLEISRSNFGVLLHRARRRLRTCLGARGH